MSFGVRIDGTHSSAQAGVPAQCDSFENSSKPSQAMQRNNIRQDCFSRKKTQNRKLLPKLPPIHLPVPAIGRTCRSLIRSNRNDHGDDNDCISLLTCGIQEGNPQLFRLWCSVAYAALRNDGSPCALWKRSSLPMGLRSGAESQQIFRSKRVSLYDPSSPQIFGSGSDCH